VSRSQLGRTRLGGPPRRRKQGSAIRPVQPQLGRHHTRPGILQARRSSAGRGGPEVATADASAGASSRSSHQRNLPRSTASPAASTGLSVSVAVRPWSRSEDVPRERRGVAAGSSRAWYTRELAQPCTNMPGSGRRSSRCVPGPLGLFIPGVRQRGRLAVACEACSSVRQP